MNDIQQIIDERKATYLDWLTELCRQPSVAAQDWGMEDTAEIVERLLTEIGATITRVPTAGYPVIVGQIAGTSDRTLMIYDHYDVQPAEPLELWDSPPFEPEVRNGTFYARGVADNKGNLVARIAAVDAYQRARGELPVNITFIFEGEEEVGSPNLGAFAEDNPQFMNADGCIWEAGYSDAQGRRTVYLGLKGMLYVELHTQQANVDLHSANAAIIPSAAWRLLQAINTLKDADDRVLIPGFYDAVRQPTEADLAALDAMPFEEQAQRERLGITAHINGLTGRALKEKLIFQPTANIAGIESGYTGEGMKTVLPHTAHAKMDFRLVPDQDPDAILQQLRDHLAASGFEDVEVRLMAAEHPARTPIDDAFAQTVIDATKAIHGHDPVVYPMTPGSGPMYPLCQKYGIPAVSIGVGNVNSRNHAPNENIHLHDYYTGIAHIAAIVERFGTT